MIGSRMLRSRIVLALLLVACGDGGTASDDAFGGSYALRATNGDPIPAALAPDGPPVIQRGELTVIPPDTLRVTLWIGDTPAAAIPRPYGFGFRQSGDSLIITIPAGAGGRLRAARVDLRLGFPAPPSQGFFLYWHDLVFVR